MQVTASRAAAITVAASIPLILLVGGCASYEARPLDPHAHHAAWSSRVVESEAVAAFARQLSAAEAAPLQFNSADGLTLPEAEVVALLFNAELRVSRLRAGVARASAEHAGLWEDPEFGFDGAYILTNVSNPWIAGATLGITFPISGRLETEKAHATAEHRAALDRIAADEWALRARLRREWLEWSALVKQIELARQFITDLDAVVAVADRLEAAGEMARPEARLFRVERVSRQNDLRLLEAGVREAELRIRSLLGVSITAPLQLIPSLARDHPQADDHPLRMESNNPTLATLRSQYEVAEKSLHHEIRKQYPDITIGPGGGTEEGDSRVLLGVSLPIPLWNRNQRGVAEATAARELARAEVEAAVESMTFLLSAAQIRAAAVTQQRRELEDVVVPMVDEQYADVERIARAGDFNVLLSLETLVRRRETKSRLIQSRLEEALAIVAVEELLGPTPTTPSASAVTETTP